MHGLVGRGVGFSILPPWVRICVIGKGSKYFIVRTTLQLRTLTLIHLDSHLGSKFYFHCDTQYCCTLDIKL